MFELSARLIGIYKVANQTRSVAIGELPSSFFLSCSKRYTVSESQNPRSRAMYFLLGDVGTKKKYADNKELSELKVESDIDDDDVDEQGGERMSPKRGAPLPPRRNRSEMST